MILPEAHAEPSTAPASAIERAVYVPDLSVRPVPSVRPEPQPAARSGLVVLVHDGQNRELIGAIETGLGAGFHGSDRLLVLHGLPAGEEAESLRYFLDRHKPQEVVFVPSLAERDDLAAVCARAHVRCIRIGSSDLPGCDERSASATAVKWLVALGHARIGLIAGPETSASAQRRELGYLDAMAEHGLDRGPSLIVAGDDSFNSGIEAGRLLLEISPRPTAIIASNDEMAAGVLHAARALAVSVPADLSVIGFDDTPLAQRCLPQLTSMHVPWERIGHEAALHIVSGAPLPDGRFEPEMIVRNSVTPLA